MCYVLGNSSFKQIKFVQSFLDGLLAHNVDLYFDGGSLYEYSPYRPTLRVSGASCTCVAIE